MNERKGMKKMNACGRKHLLYFLNFSATMTIPENDSMFRGNL
jgi:hypothetical protein